ncbi:hypothetical protein GCM10023261_09020 [Bartonella jaculi]|uniref:Uncharacterized protein n=1 Tax=Bartonella jaculi TaxID=686226 RepID=A0ABP9N5F9_9HYPH
MPLEVFFYFKTQDEEPDGCKDMCAIPWLHCAQITRQEWIQEPKLGTKSVSKMNVLMDIKW